MGTEKYADPATGRPLDPFTEGGPLDAWAGPTAAAPCALHPDGFPVFVRRAGPGAADEYVDGDPYGIEVNLDTDFQQQRIEATVDLVGRAIGGRPGRPARILDVGCGQGHITARILAEFPDAEISALDLSATAIAEARNRYPGIDFCVADGTRPPYARGYFDVIVLNNIWEHVEAPLLLLAGLGPVLQPGGSVIVSTPNRYRRGNLLRALLGRPMALMSKHHVTEYSRGQMVEQLSWSGYRVVDVASRLLRSASLQARIFGVGCRVFSAVTGSPYRPEATLFYRAVRSG